jgi:4-amino-4-deoxy-L-arabinose transferase-like glycosyltransferase
LNPSSEHLRVTAWLLILFAFAYFWFTQKSDFPWFYHPDEHKKVRQLIEGDYNFNHPMLLLWSTDLAQRLTGTPPEQQAVVELGRHVSAFFSTAAIVCFALLAYWKAGWAAMLLTSLLLLPHQQVFELSHYLKEDTALMFGCAGTALALVLYRKFPGLLSLCLLGLAVGLATSAKYIGALLILPALFGVWSSGERRGRWWRLLILAGAVVATILVVNFPALERLAVFSSSLQREWSFVIEGNRNVTRSVPHLIYLNVFVDNTTPILWLMLLLACWAFWRLRSRLKFDDYALIGIPLAYFILLSCSPKTNDRYFLPITGFIYLLASIGFVQAVRLLNNRFRGSRWISIVALVVAFVAVGWETAAVFPYYRAFSTDDRREMWRWLEQLATSDLLVVADEAAKLRQLLEQSPGQRSIRLLNQEKARYAADYGTIETLRREGVRYVVVARTDYGRFFLRSLRPKADDRMEFEQAKQFYESLFASANKVWTRDRGPVLYLHPGLEIYDLGSSRP